MTHDPLCPYKPPTHTECDHYSDHPLGNPYAQTRCAVVHFSPGVACQCDLIAKVRADERERVLAEGPYFTSVVHHCCVELQDLKAKS